MEDRSAEEGYASQGTTPMQEESQVIRYEPMVPTRGQSRRLAPLDPLEMGEMKEAPAPLAYWRVLQKRRGTILSIFFLLLTVVLIGTLLQTPIYRAKAVLEIEKENPTLPTLQEAFQVENVSNTYLETQYNVLESESVAQRVIDQLQLENLGEFNSQQGKSADRDPHAVEPAAPGAASLSQRNPEVYDHVLKHFQERLSIEPIKNSRLVAVSFESQDPELAARAVNALTSSYAQQSSEVGEQATEWLTQQLALIKTKLEKSEDELQKYARANQLLFLENQEGNPENIDNVRLRQLQEELTKAQAARFEKEALYRLVEAGDFGSLPGVFENSLMQDLTIRLADLKREHAQLTATFSPDYPKVKQVQKQIDELESVLARERERAARRITNDYLASAREEKLLRGAFQGQQAQVNAIAERSIQYKILKREVDTNKQLYEDLLQRLRQAGVSAGLKASHIRIVDRARVPGTPARPNLPLNLVLAVLLGLSLGVGAACLQEHLDSSLKSPNDVERFLQAPALALIPCADSLNSEDGGNSLQERAKGIARRAKRLARRTHLLTAGNGDAKPTPPLPTRWYRIDGDGQQHSILSEAFRSLRTSVLLSRLEAPLRSLLVTSSEPAEGKTTVATNLAISLAQLGRHVLLIDADLRRPSIHKAFDLTNHGGLVTCLTSEQDWRATVQPTGVAGLDALVCGPVPLNPSELLSSENMRTLLSQSVADYDFVLLDSPPLLDLADARILATLVEGLVLVVRGGATPRELVYRAEMEARHVGANVIGVVLNRLDHLSSDYYYFRFYRGHYYGKEG